MAGGGTVPNPRILYNNISTWVFSSSIGSLAAYPKENLNDFDPQLIWSGSATTNPFTMSVDMGTPTSCSMVALSNHNFASIQGDITTLNVEYSSDFVTWNILWTGAPTQIADPMILSWSVQAVRYYRIVAKDITSFAAVPYCGLMFFGHPFEFTQPYDWGYKAGNTEYNTATYKALDGSVRSAQTYAGRSIYELNFRLQTDASASAWQTLHRTIRGRLRPFWYMDSSSSYYYARLASDYNPVTAIRYGQNDIGTLRIEGYEADL